MIKNSNAEQWVAPKVLLLFYFVDHQFQALQTYQIFNRQYCKSRQIMQNVPRELHWIIYQTTTWLEHSGAAGSHCTTVG